MYRRICLYGGPGCGKSTTALWLAAELRTRGFRAEFIPEYVKWLAFEGRHPQGMDQIKILGQQMHLEEVPLRGGVPLVVCESPILLGAAYSDPEVAEVVKLAAKIYESRYPALHYFLDRDGIDFRAEDRIHSHEESLLIDNDLRRLLWEAGDFREFRTVEREKVLVDVLKHV